MTSLAQRFEGLRLQAREAHSRRPRLFQVAGLIVLVLMAPRLVGEYYYLRIVLTDDSGVAVSSFGHLERMWWGGTGPLIRLLASKDVSNRDIAASCLAQHKGRAVVSALARAASTDPYSSVRFAALRALGDIGDPRAVPALKAIGSRIASGVPTDRPEAMDSSETEAITRALAATGEPGKQALLEFARGSQDIKWRADTLMAACSFKDDAAVREEGRRALSSESWQMREAGAVCVGLTLGRTTIDLVKPLLEDPELQVRITAAKVLGALKDTSGLSAMKAIVLDASVGRVLRSEAFTAIAEIGDKDAVPFLCDFAAREPNDRLRDDARTAASQLRPDRVTPCKGPG